MRWTGIFKRRKWTIGATALASALALALPATGQATGVTVGDLNHGATAQGLAETLVGGGVSVSNVVLTGPTAEAYAGRSAGTFTAGGSSIGFESGIVMSSGKVQTYPEDAACSQGVEGPNTCYEATGVKAQGPAGWTNATSLEAPGDEALTTLSGFQTFDATVLEFDFVPQHPTVQFSYVFGSDEYNDFSNTPYNDVFAFFINGNNCALVPGTGEPVAVNTINNGNDQEGADVTPHHPELFRDNVRPEPTIQSQMDGLTSMLTCTANVTPGQPNHMRLAIADASDPIYDSAVFIQSRSLVSGTQLSTQLTGGTASGEQITVPQGTAVSDHGVLSGPESPSATGTVEYRVYSDPACKSLVTSAGSVSVAGGTAPPSTPQTLGLGTYYWQASYSGDGNNNASTSPCGSEVLTVSASTEEEPEGEADPTTVVTSLSGGGQTGASISVGEGIAASDRATIRGTNAVEATGTVSYAIYSDNACTKPVTGAGSVSVAGGVVPASNPTTLPAGTYYWQASYGGDKGNLPSKSACGTEVENVGSGGPHQEAPEFGRFLKVAKGAGRFGSATCTGAAGTKTYEWVTGAAKAHFSSALKEGTAMLETSKAQKVICAGLNSHGDYTGAHTVGNVVMVFTGCELAKVKCLSAGAKEGEIVSSVLEGQLGVISTGATAVKNKIGLDLFPAGGTHVADFACRGTAAVVRGSVIAPVTANKMLLSSNIVYAALAKGRQKPEAFLGVPKDVLEASLGGAPFEQSALKAKLSQTSEEALEVNSVT
jgi:hypothetical protein